MAQPIWPFHDQSTTYSRPHAHANCLDVCTIYAKWRNYLHTIDVGYCFWPKTYAYGFHRLCYGALFGAIISTVIASLVLVLIDWLYSNCRIARRCYCAGVDEINFISIWNILLYSYMASSYTYLDYNRQSRVWNYVFKSIGYSCKITIICSSNIHGCVLCNVWGNRWNASLCVAASAQILNRSLCISAF